MESTYSKNKNKSFSNPSADRNQTLIEQQRKPFQILFATCDDFEEGITLVSLREHIIRAVGLFAKLEGLPSANFSTGCYANLHMAASLHGLDVDTDIKDDGMWCGNVSNYESVRSEIVSTFVAGRLAFEMIFHAYEILGQHYISKSRSVTTQQISRKLMSDETYRPLRGFVEVSSAAITFLPFEFDSRTQDAKRSIALSSHVGLGAECVRQFRNALIHGKLQAPEPIEWHDRNDPTPSQQAKLFRSQIRLCLLLIQTIVERMIGEETVEDTDFQEFTVRDVVAALHLGDMLDDDEDDPDELILAGLKAAPRFHYW